MAIIPDTYSTRDSTSFLVVVMHDQKLQPSVTQADRGPDHGFFFSNHVQSNARYNNDKGI